MLLELQTLVILIGYNINQGNEENVINPLTFIVILPKHIFSSYTSPILHRAERLARCNFFLHRRSFRKQLYIKMLVLHVKMIYNCYI